MDRSEFLKLLGISPFVIKSALMPNKASANASPEVKPDIAINNHFYNGHGLLVSKNNQNLILVKKFSLHCWSGREFGFEFVEAYTDRISDVKNAFHNNDVLDVLFKHDKYIIQVKGTLSQIGFDLYFEDLPVMSGIINGYGEPTIMNK